MYKLFLRWVMWHTVVLGAGRYVISILCASVLFRNKIFDFSSLCFGNAINILDRKRRVNVVMTWQMDALEH